MLREFYKKFDIKHVTSFVEHLQTNDQTKVMNKIIVVELKRKLGHAK